MSSLLRALAASAPAPVFAVAGEGGREAVQDLRLHAAQVRLLDTPRAANVLLIAGLLPLEMLEPAMRAHDAMSLPRATVWWAPSRGSRPGSGEGQQVERAFPEVEIVEDAGDLAAAAARVNRELVAGGRRSEVPLLPDVPPAPWRGVGPYGQGGSGMTGGVPYGRPMAERAEDRDGLMLDQLPAAIGPFFPPFPPGLTLDVRFQGDLVQAAEPRPNPFAGAAGARLSASSAFFRALREPVSIFELEMARARSHLRWLSEALRVQGLESLALRVLRLAHQAGPPDAARVSRLRTALRLSQSTGWATRGVAPIEGGQVRGMGLGPVARASGIDEDLRAEDAAYRAIGFRTIVNGRGDAASRLEQRLAEAAQALELAGRAGTRTVGPLEQVEAPRGRLAAGSDASTRLLQLVPGLLAGQPWDAAVTALVSLDIDLEEAAGARAVSGEGAPA